MFQIYPASLRPQSISRPCLSYFWWLLGAILEGHLATLLLRTKTLRLNKYALSPLSPPNPSKMGKHDKEQSWRSQQIQKAKEHHIILELFRDDRCSCQSSLNLILITVTVSLLVQQQCSCRKQLLRGIFNALAGIEVTGNEIPLGTRLLHTFFCFGDFSGKKKAHKHKLFDPVALGTPRECPWDRPGLSPGQSGFVPGTNPGFLLIYTAEAQFVPGTHPVCPWDIPGTKGGRKSLCVKSLCASFVPWILFGNYYRKLYSI